MMKQGDNIFNGVPRDTKGLMIFTLIDQSVAAVHPLDVSEVLHDSAAPPLPGQPAWEYAEVVTLFLEDGSIKFIDPMWWKSLPNAISPKPQAKIA